MITAAEASAGVVYLHKTIAVGRTLRVINMINETTAFVATTLELMRVGDSDTSSETIALKHKQLQTGLKDVHWEGNIELTSDFRRIRGSQANIVAADVVYLTVGYE